MSYELTTSMQTVSLAAPQRIVVVDALNFLHSLVPIEDPTFRDAFAPALFQEAELRVAAVAQAARVSQFNLIWVFDNGQATEEAKEKWKERRLIEVMEEKRALPCSAETVLYALLQQAGFLVLYPPGIDGDDAVALLAYKCGGDALSGDRDLLRYPMLPRARVFKDFAISVTTGEMLLEPQRAPLPEGVASRSLAELALNHLRSGTSREALLREWGMESTTLIYRAFSGESKRGNADGLTKECGNLNKHVLPLMASLYAQLNVGSVAVTLPTAVRNDNGEVIDAQLVTTDIAADPCVAKKLVTCNPKLTKQWIEESTQWAGLHTEQDLWWGNFTYLLKNASRAHAVSIVAAEIVDTALYLKGDYGDGGVDNYSSPQRIWAIYKSLIRKDERLNPSRFTQSIWKDLSQEERTIYCQILVPDSTTTAVHVRRNGADDWCCVKICKGLFDRHTNAYACRATSEQTKWCFPINVARQRAKDKDALCHECIATVCSWSKLKSAQRGASV